MSDPRQQSKVRLTAAGTGVIEGPVQKPVAAESFVRPAGGPRVAPVCETYLKFTPDFRLDDLEAVLNTTGFTGLDQIAEVPLVNTPVSEPEAPGSVAPPNLKPALEVRPLTTPIAVYEPIEFLDYDDEDESDSVDVFQELAPEPESDPPVLTQPIAFTLPDAAPPAVAKMLQGFTAVVLADAPIEIPELALPTVRPRILRGPNPKAAPVVEARPSEPRPSEPRPTPAPRSAPAVAKPPQPTIRPAVPPPPAVVQRPAAAASTALAKPEPPRPSGQPERDKRQAAKAPVPTQPSPANRPVRDRGNAVSVEEVIEQPSPAPKPKMVPIRKPEPIIPETGSTQIPRDLPILGLEADRKTPAAKFGMVAVIAAVLAGGAFITFSSGNSTGHAASGSEGATSSTSSGAVIGGGGWTTTWGADAPTNKGKQISIYRPSMTMPDYRFEFRGQIERKALGWIFRAQDPKNYYVAKLQTIKAGPNPVVALVRYAVISGKETTHTQLMLPSELSRDTLYQVRVDVEGDKFTTYVQGKPLDYWTDDRIKLGGAGFYTESGERSQIKSSQVSYLR